MLTSIVAAALLSAEPAWPPPPLISAPDDGWSAPPLVPAEGVDSPSASGTSTSSGGSSSTRLEREQPAPAAKADDELPFWSVKGLATANVPLSLSGYMYLVGFRAELDVWHITSQVTLDRTLKTPLGIADIQQWNALLGGTPVRNKYVQLKALAGATVLATSTDVRTGFTVGATGRVGISFIALEAAAVWTPLPFRQLDLRAELVLKGGIFELHGGYRARFLDQSEGGSMSTLFAQAPVSGPAIALGFAF